MGLCFALDLCGIWTSAHSPTLGARIQSLSGSVNVVSVHAGGALDRLGIRAGDTVLSIAGRAAEACAFYPDHVNLSLSWSDQDCFSEWQNFLWKATRNGSIQITFQTQDGRRAVTVPTPPVGWFAAWQRGLSLRLVGTVFLLVFLFIWTSRRREASLMGIVAGVGIFISFTTSAVFQCREFCLSPAFFSVGAVLNYLGTQSPVLCLHLAWVWPTAAAFLLRRPWLRLLPWAAYILQLILHFDRVFPKPAWTYFPLCLLSLAGLMATVALRMVRESDPLIKAQLRWAALGCVVGFLPWILLTVIPQALGLDMVSERYSLLFVGALPICLAFSIFRYRLLDVNLVFDWVMAHAVILGLFSLVELAFWSWLGNQITPHSFNRALPISIGMFLLIFLYAPLRIWLLHMFTRLAGKERPSLADSLQNLLECARDSKTPVQALERSLNWTLKPERLQWIHLGQGHDAEMARLQLAQDGMIGYQFGELCPEKMESVAWVPVYAGTGEAAILLWPQGSNAWSRSDLYLARMVVRAAEPLIEIEHLQREHRIKEASLREQRDDLVREMHDGLGSQLFGASLLTNAAEDAPPQLLKQRMAEVNAALADAMDSLRAGLTVLGAPPGAFGPAVMALLLRGERVLEAAGIALQTQVEDDVISLRLDSRSVFALLRTMQEALTNIARHSRCKHAEVRIERSGPLLSILIQDDGRGFDLNRVPAGHGIANMKRRLQQLGGEAIISTPPGKGCTIALKLPLRQENHE
jgi:signal transduction histidine kinase